MRTQRLRLLLLAALLAQRLPLARAEPAISQVEQPTEYQVKAAFLYNFIKFVQWPADAFENADAILVIGVLGTNPFGDTLAAELNGKKVQDRTIMLKHLKSLDDVKHCQVLFIAPSESLRMAAIVQALQHAPVLTVGDDERFVHRGGMIGFSVENSRIRFSINRAAANQANLSISSQLLKLAKAVVE